MMFKRFRASRECLYKSAFRANVEVIPFWTENSISKSQLPEISKKKLNIQKEKTEAVPAKVTFMNDTWKGRRREWRDPSFDPQINNFVVRDYWKTGDWIPSSMCRVGLKFSAILCSSLIELPFRYSNYDTQNFCIF